MVFPSRATRSEGRARSPSLATRPLTLTRPASIQASMPRREPSPAAASSFCSRSPSAGGSAAGAGGALGFGLGAGFRPFSSGGFGDARSSGRFGGLLGGGLKLESLRDFLERRQLLERAQPEVVEELPGGGIQRRPAGRLAVADHVDPAARLERLDDLRRHHDPAHILDVAAGDRLAVR